MNASSDHFEQRVFAVLPFLLLVASAAFDQLIDGADAAHLAIAGATALWIALTRNRIPAPVHFVGLLAFSAALVACTPIYGFFVWSGYLAVAFLLPRRWIPAGVLGVAAVTAASQVGGWPGGGFSDWLVYVAVVIANAGVAGTMMVVGAKQDDQRRMLEAALRENAGLHAQLLEQAREAGMLDERARMAREIHDTIAQGLIGIVTQIEAAEQAHEPRRHLDAAAQLARDSLAEARRSVRALRPQPLERARLPEALAQVADGWSALHGIAAAVSTTGAPRPLPVDVEATLLRTAQESLANVAKHASASRVGLTLSYMDDLVTLDVRDDGVGGAAPRPGGFGLTSMLERVQGLQGSLAIESEPGSGTAVSASVPA
ncbi:sensor histidine kinase [Candidatus Solirubrobacter pratensis]|uniref:sensor histidine kinase n=1 Tax=Candidatus Solirubrobacter pratensis TaxID=1298857 RepID=UPI00041A422E|nr:sensor histidine kinase [Candidatus Solirubrobacter pratensis]